ncbi:alpha/beta hydrolase [Marinomonas transparens]|uniref:Alpha/beta hydrolase n=1 Tax=Marinomonas transparens TaxID=2795388 RepID=A0A934MX66_9GAMM|nr:alpha/beta hydrolase [Marinomonas transparens]MBJ7538974.1 alpha/beta hydrolase [Marinomonas transparens]
MNTKIPYLSTIKWLLLCASIVLAGCVASSVQQNNGLTDGELSIEVENNTAYLSGVLGHDLVEKLTDFVKQNPNITDLVLVDIPGSVDQEATMEGARLIHRLGLNTHIARTGYVLSGGVDLFLGGIERTIGAGAGVGVHSWSDGSSIKATEVNMADSIHATYVNFYLEMGVPDRFYWFSLDAAPADRVYFLSPEEVYDFQLVTQ